MPAVIRMPLGLPGDVIRTVLFLVNLLLFVLSFFVFIFSLLIKLGHHSRAGEHHLIANDLDLVLKTNSIDSATTLFLILAAVVMLFSLIGIYGTNQLDKVFLVAAKNITETFFVRFQTLV